MRQAEYYRIKAGWTRKQLADIAGVSDSSVYKGERENTHNMLSWTRERIVLALNTQLYDTGRIPKKLTQRIFITEASEEEEEEEPNFLRTA